MFGIVNLVKKPMARELTDLRVVLHYLAFPKLTWHRTNIYVYIFRLNIWIYKYLNKDVYTYTYLYRQMLFQFLITNACLFSEWQKMQGLADIQDA